MDGPCFICIVCNRCLYKRSNIDYKEEKYNIFVEVLYTDIKSFDGKLHVCRKCNLKLKKGKVPCQAVCYKLAVSCLPDQFKSVRKLERVLISKRLLFKKVKIMPKGQSPKLKEALCNIPVEHIDVNSLLSRLRDSKGLVTAKLKKKLEYKEHVLFEPVRTRFIVDLLSYLKRVNYLYKDITIVPEMDLEMVENPLDIFRIASNKTTLISNFPNADSEEFIISIARRERQRPM